MQITKELLDLEVKSMVGQNEIAKASMYKTDGALSVLRGLREYMDRPDPEPEKPISEENQKVQDTVEAAQEVVKPFEPDMNVLADAIVPVEEPSGQVEQLPVAPEKLYRTDGNGKYVEVTDAD